MAKTSKRTPAHPDGAHVASSKDAKPKGKKRLRSIRVHRADNGGATVHHEYEDASEREDGMSRAYYPSEEHAFGDADEAGAHIAGALKQMGLKSKAKAKGKAKNDGD